MRNTVSERSEEQSQPVVYIRQAHKYYGSKKSPHVVFDGLDMTVPRGCIYGLLGASGCGKTTLMKCITGIIKLDSGEIFVLGGMPRPGPRIGYMPQDLCLYKVFSIRETMKYFGWLTNMAAEEIEKRTEYFISLLNLPSTNQQVKDLSGGQQRRLSLAVAILHDPELLILDEPTVGIDSLLRQSIWNYLIELTNVKKATIILSTHYIEETRQAGVVGLLRKGKLLAEEPPDKLMQMYDCRTLEDVFLKLCTIQNQEMIQCSQTINTQEIPSSSTDQKSFKMVVCDKQKHGPLFVNANILQIMIWKNFFWMWRNYESILFFIGLPVIQTVLCYLTIGQVPVGLHLAVYNGELHGSSNVCVSSPRCSLVLLSCVYLEYLENNNFILDYYDSIENIKKAVRNGEAWGAVHVPSNFSDSLLKIMENRIVLRSKTFEESVVEIWLDYSNIIIGILLEQSLLDAYNALISDISRHCGYKMILSEIPIHFDEPTHGIPFSEYPEFVTPWNDNNVWQVRNSDQCIRLAKLVKKKKLISTMRIVFFLTFAIALGGLVVERGEGMIERSIISGATSIEFLLSHVTFNTVILCVQMAIIFVISLVGFQVPCRGNVFTSIALTFLAGTCGMSYGLFVSSLVDDIQAASIIGLGSFFPLIALCGIVWPLEGMHYALRPISVILPLTKSSAALRAIFSKGWPITNPTVYIGFLTVIIWILIFLTLTLIALKCKKT